MRLERQVHTVSHIALLVVIWSSGLNLSGHERGREGRDMSWFTFWTMPLAGYLHFFFCSLILSFMDSTLNPSVYSDGMINVLRCYFICFLLKGYFASSHLHLLLRTSKNNTHAVHHFI